MREPLTMRILQDPPLDGPTNMARDETLLTLVGAGNCLPTLRLYEWNEPTISLGYFQHYSEYEALGSPLNRLAVVRRTTGGGAILHDRELTYAIAMPFDSPFVEGNPNQIYEWIHAAVIDCVSGLNVVARQLGTDQSPPQVQRARASGRPGIQSGPFFCFARRHRYDVIVGGEKLAGSAQRRTSKAVLQHGSIIIENRFEHQPTAVLPGPFDSALSYLRKAFPSCVARYGPIDLAEGVWSSEELSVSEPLVAKYAGLEWTRRL